MGEPGVEYRRACRGYARGEISSEEFIKQAERLVERAVVSQGQDAYGYWRNLGASLALADEPKRAPVTVLPRPATVGRARRPTAPAQRRAAAPQQNLGRRWFIALIGVPVLMLAIYSASLVSDAGALIVGIPLFLLLAAVHDNVR